MQILLELAGTWELIWPSVIPKVPSAYVLREWNKSNNIQQTGRFISCKTNEAVDAQLLLFFKHLFQVIVICLFAKH